MTATVPPTESRQARQAAYYLKNKSKCRANNDRWKSENKERYQAIIAQWREKNRDKILQQSKAAYARNKAKRLAQQREWRINNSAKFQTYVKKWRSKNPAKVSAAASLRRARLKQCDTSKKHEVKRFTTDVRAKASVRCYYCRRKLSPSEVQIDHVVPITKRGEHSGANVCVACIHCNSSKNNRLLSEWKTTGQQVLPL
jgi:5-methylcytosine-specific restriction endonuclease McrA